MLNMLINQQVNKMTNDDSNGVGIPSSSNGGTTFSKMNKQHKQELVNKMKDVVPTVLLNQWLDIKPEKSAFTKQECCIDDADEYSVYSDDTISNALSSTQLVLTKQASSFAKRGSVLQNPISQKIIRDSLNGQRERRNTVVIKQDALTKKLSQAGANPIVEIEFSDLSSSLSDAESVSPVKTNDIKEDASTGDGSTDRSPRSPGLLELINENKSNQSQQSSNHLSSRSDDRPDEVAKDVSQAVSQNSTLLKKSEEIVQRAEPDMSKKSFIIKKKVMKRNQCVLDTNNILSNVPIKAHQTPIIMKKKSMFSTQVATPTYTHHIISQNKRYLSKTRGMKNFMRPRRLSSKNQIGSLKANSEILSQVRRRLMTFNHIPVNTPVKVNDLCITGVGFHRRSSHVSCKRPLVPSKRVSNTKMFFSPQRFSKPTSILESTLQERLQKDSLRAVSTLPAITKYC